MSVYVDKSRYPYRRGFRRMIMCHMTADSLAELHVMADKIGVQRKWFQAHPRHPHYDVCKSKRALAVKLGAIELTDEQVRERVKAQLLKERNGEV